MNSAGLLLFRRAAGPYLELGTVRQRNGKRVTAWAVEADFDAAAIVSRDRPGGVVPGRSEARAKMIAGQDALLDRLLAVLG